MKLKLKLWFLFNNFLLNREGVNSLLLAPKPHAVEPPNKKHFYQILNYKVISILTHFRLF